MAQSVPPRDLRLIAFDADDLETVSALVQDACVRVGDMAWLPEERRFALVLSRFDWEASVGAGQKSRSRAALHFDRVRDVRQQNVPQTRPETVLNLLAVSFEPGAAPSGFVRLDFSGGAAIRLDVECVEAALRDLGPRWAARFRPGHRA